MKSRIGMGRLAYTLILTAWCASLSGNVAIAAPDATFVAGIIEANCVACHGPSMQNAGVRLDNLPVDFGDDRRATEEWHDVRNALNSGRMPPRDASNLSTEDRTVLLDWLDAALADSEHASEAAGTVMRRLNRVEYQNTMRDLVGLDIDYVRNLPADEASRDGFTNNGAALRMSALLVEHYLRAARDGLGRAIVTGPAPPVFEHRAEETVVDKVKTVNWSNRLGRTGTFAARVPEFPDEGEFVLRITARAEGPPAAPYPRMHVSLGYRADTQTPSRTVAEVDVPDRSPRVFEFRARIEEFPLQSRTQSKYPGLLVWVRNAYTDGQPPPPPEKVPFEENGKLKDKLVWTEDPEFPKIVVESVEFRAPVYESWPPAHHKRLVPIQPESVRDEERAVRASLRRFLRLAYRRPVRDAEVSLALRYFETVRPTVETFEEALREVLSMALISPDFLYRIEDAEIGTPLNDHQLASRLSYFLWSTMPDERLMDLADRGLLSDPAALRRETERMLDDSRSWAFVERFSDEWLDLGGVHRIAINPNYYPGFDALLKGDMRRETQHYFAEILRQDDSAMKFLRSDFAMLNQPLAVHYGVSGPRGGDFQRVNIDAARGPGGLLTQASVLLSNSTGEDSHPVERGVWIRRALLGDPPAPPPPAVPNLETGDPDFGLLPVKRQLELHQDNEACARCHQGIDPWGIALEEFDAVGLRRDKITRRSGERVEVHSVDARTVLPDGSEVEGVNGLAQHLVDERRHQFARAFASKLASYALGRSLVHADEGSMDGIVAHFEKSGYRVRELCTIIVTSELFRSR